MDVEFVMATRGESCGADAGPSVRRESATRYASSMVSAGVIALSLLSLRRAAASPPIPPPTTTTRVVCVIVLGQFDEVAIATRQRMRRLTLLGPSPQVSGVAHPRSWRNDGFSWSSSL
jgi:hypothetical protein